MSEDKKYVMKNTNILDLVVLTTGETKFSQIKNTIKTAVNQEGPIPHSLVVVIDGALNYFKLVSKLKPLFKDVTTKPLFTKTFDVNLDELSKVDVGVSKCSGLYYTVFEAGEVVPANLVSQVQLMIANEDATVLIEPVDGLNGLTVQKYVHDFLQGNRTCPLIEKIKYLAKEENKEGIVKQWVDLTQLSS